MDGLLTNEQEQKLQLWGLVVIVFIGGLILLTQEVLGAEEEGLSREVRLGHRLMATGSSTTFRFLVATNETAHVLRMERNERSVYTYPRAWGSGVLIPLRNGEVTTVVVPSSGLYSVCLDLRYNAEKRTIEVLTNPHRCYPVEQNE